MKKLKTKIIAAAVVAGLAGISYAQTSQQGHGSMPMDGMDPAAMQRMMSEMTPSPNDPASTQDFKVADMQMMMNMRVPYTGNPDVEFRTHMIPHHQGAIE